MQQFVMFFCATSVLKLGFNSKPRFLKNKIFSHLNFSGHPIWATCRQQISTLVSKRFHHCWWESGLQLWLQMAVFSGWVSGVEAQRKCIRSESQQWDQDLPFYVSDYQGCPIPMHCNRQIFALFLCCTCLLHLSQYDFPFFSKTSLKGCGFDTIKIGMHCRCRIGLSEREVEKRKKNKNSRNVWYSPEGHKQTSLKRTSAKFKSGKVFAFYKYSCGIFIQRD